MPDSQKPAPAGASSENTDQEERSVTVGGVTYPIGPDGSLVVDRDTPSTPKH